jgi:hypothetical protein
MCYAKVHVENKRQFRHTKKVLNEFGYTFEKEPDACDECQILLWKDGKRKMLSKAKITLHASCRKVSRRALKKFLRGYRKTASQCKDGVYRIDKDGSVAYFASVKLAAKALNKRSMNIYKAANPHCKELKTAYGYEWTYEEPTI